MKTLGQTIVAMTLILPSLVIAFEPLDTRIRSVGEEIHLIKTTLTEGILAVHLMARNQSDEEIKILNTEIDEIQYIANGRSYPVLQDGDNNWIASPYGGSDLFYQSSVDVVVGIMPGKSIIGWMKLEVPDDDQWPIELNLPETLAFIYRKTLTENAFAL